MALAYIFQHLVLIDFPGAALLIVYSLSPPLLTVYLYICHSALGIISIVLLLKLSQGNFAVLTGNSAQSTSSHMYQHLALCFQCWLLALYVDRRNFKSVQELGSTYAQQCVHHAAVQCTVLQVQ